LTGRFNDALDSLDRDGATKKKPSRGASAAAKDDHGPGGENTCGERSGRTGAGGQTDASRLDVGFGVRIRRLGVGFGVRTERTMVVVCRKNG